MNKGNALIGSTGFIGSTLLKQAKFDFLYNSKNIHMINGLDFEIVVCSGAPAQKWIANKNPQEDRRNIEKLIENLSTINSKTFILISTVDVFENPFGVNEGSLINEEGLHAYGYNRRLLEKFVEQHFQKSLIVRLPGLVGPGLRKNIIYDFLNKNKIHEIDSRGVFQYYPTVNLWFDIKNALLNCLPLVHFTAEPITVSQVSRDGFGRQFLNIVSESPANYDMQTLYATEFGSAGNYQYTARETIQAIRTYAQTESLISLPSSGYKK